jgi:AraC-like DNA-binding protein
VVSPHTRSSRHRESDGFLDPIAFQAAIGAMTQRLEYSVVAELQPILEAISRSLRGRHRLGDRDVSVTLPLPEGRTLVVSVRTANQHFEPPSDSSARGLNARQLRLVTEAIHEKIGEPISVSMLSTVAGLSRSHFSHAFRTSLGRTPHAHIVRLRIERAMKLMTDSDAPLSEIALATGFSDQAHFSNKFRRSAGMTPAQWRRLHDGKHMRAIIASPLSVALGPHDTSGGINERE